MSEPSRPPTLAEIMRSNPEAKAYWAEVSSLIARRDAAPVVECETCGSLGYVRVDVPVDHPLFGKPIPCPNPDCPVREQKRQARYAVLCTKAQIPDGYQSLSFANWQALAADAPDYLDGKRDAYGAALAFVAARGARYFFSLDDAARIAGLDVPEVDRGLRNSLVLSGAPGVGKTSLAVSIAHVLLDAFEGAVYVQLTQFFDALKKTFDEDAVEDEDDVLKRYQQAPVLILDELHGDAGKVGKSDWRRGRLYDLVNYRYANQMPTVVTTNFSAAQIEAAWGLPTAHRLEAMAHWLHVGGLELRRREGEVVSR